jgi:NADP-dependent 3-hydroxy acid dehydrogenase YdfG
MRRLDGKTAVITGASSGIGAAVARQLHALGANVVLGARRSDRLKELANELGQVRVTWAEVDIRIPEQVEALFSCAENAFGRVDCLIANAGIGAYGGILEISDKDVRELVDTNLTGTVWSVRHAIPYFSGGGDIVLISSVAGLRGRHNEAVYAATKHGIIGLAGSLDRELRSCGIQVTALCPGATETEFAMGRGRTPDMAHLKDMMRPDDIAEAVSYVLTQPRSMRTLLWSLRSAGSEN